MERRQQTGFDGFDGFDGRAATLVRESGAGALPEGFLFGVATAGFQVEGGYNGPGEPANNWLGLGAGRAGGAVGDRVGFWDRPEESLDRAAGLGCNSFRLSVEWARVVPDASGRSTDDAARPLLPAIVDGCLRPRPRAAGHPAPLHPPGLAGRGFLAAARRPGSLPRPGSELAVDALAPWVRHWVTINEINVLVIGSWLLGMFPPGRTLGFEDARDRAGQSAGRPRGWPTRSSIGWRPDAVVTTNNSCLSIYEYDRLLTDLLLARSMGVDRGEIDDWLVERRRLHDSPAPGRADAGERLLTSG